MNEQKESLPNNEISINFYNRVKDLRNINADKMMLKFLTLSLLIISSIILYFNSSDISGQSEIIPIPTPNKLLPTYMIDITTGSGINYKFQHFYPPDIAIPIGTTVEWFDDDPEQIHTVTSGAPGSSNPLFNSGIMQYTSTLQYTFDQPGTVSYHCQIHPWMIGSVYVSDSNKQGKILNLVQVQVWS
jgi:plastocyanin